MVFPRTSRRSSRRTLLPLACALVFVATGCASYEKRTREAFTAFRSGHFRAAYEEYVDRSVTGSDFLAGAEAGTAALTGGAWEDALKAYDMAADQVRTLEDRALVSGARALESLGTWVLNESATSYDGEGFERVYLHCGLALAYLALGRLDSVYVEARRSNALLEREEELYETEYRAGGFGHLLSALAYELTDDPDNAYIDYARMVEKGVGVPLAGRALVRISAETGREQDLERWVERFGPDPERPEGAASVVVLGGVGLGPYKEEISITVPLPSGFFNWAVPDYVRRPQPVSRLQLRLPATGDAIDTVTIDTVEVENVTQVAEDNLDDRIAWLAAKSAARGFAKRELTKELDDQVGILGRIAGEVFSFVTERADLRCWQTLPHSWQAARLYVPPGVHRLELAAVGGETVRLGTFELAPGETMFVLARSLDRRLIAHPVGGLRLQDSTPVPSLSK